MIILHFTSSSRVYIEVLSRFSVQQTNMNVGGAQQIVIEAPPPPLSGMESWLCQRLNSIPKCTPGQSLSQTIISEVMQT